MTSFHSVFVLLWAQIHMLQHVLEKKYTYHCGHLHDYKNAAVEFTLKFAAVPKEMLLLGNLPCTVKISG